MDNKSNKKISTMIIKLIAIAVSVFVFSYAWFVYDEETNVTGVSVGTAKTNNVQISNDGVGGWGSTLNIDVGEDFMFDNEVTSMGMSFYKAATKDSEGNPIGFVLATANKDYLDFDLWFKNDSPISLFLEENSIVYPECGTEESKLIYDSSNPSANINDIVRISAYGDFSRDLISGAVRVAFIEYLYDEETDTYTLDTSPNLVWAPNPGYEIVLEGDHFFADLNSTNSQNYNYIKVFSTTNFAQNRVNNLKDNVNASYNTRSSNGDPILLTIDTVPGVEKKAGLKIRVWVEGNDREAIQALKGGLFKFNLSFLGLHKEENSNVPAVTANTSTHQIVGITEEMQYSTDYANTWIDYYSGHIFEISSDDTVYVRYKETINTFASDYIELNF